MKLIKWSFCVGLSHEYEWNSLVPTISPRLFWIAATGLVFQTASPSSHVKQWFVHPNESPTVMITFSQCQNDPLWFCLFWLYWDNGHLLCLITGSVSGSTLFSILSFTPCTTPLQLCAPPKRRWRPRWHGTAHLSQLLQKQRENSTLDHQMTQLKGEWE